MSFEPVSEATPSISPSIQIPDGSNPEESWVFIRDHLHKPFSSTHTPSIEEFIAAYTAAVNFMRIAKSNRSQRVVAKLYSNIAAFVHSNTRAGVEPILSRTDEEIVAFYISSWENFQTIAKHNGRLLQYMNRHYVQLAIDEGKAGVYPIETLHTVCWKEDVLDKLEDKLKTWLQGSEEDEDKKVEREKLKECYEALERELGGTNVEIASFSEFSKNN